MSRQPLSEADAHNELLRLELLRLEALKTELLKQQGIYKVSELVLEEQSAKEAEKHKKTLKRQAKFLKEAMDQRPEVETLASLKRTYEQPDEKQRSTCEFQHGLLVDEIAAKRISKPGESDTSKLIWSPGAEAIRSQTYLLAIESLAAKARLHQKYQGSLPGHWHKLLSKKLASNDRGRGMSTRQRLCDH